MALVIASTTDTPEQVDAAVNPPATPAAPDPVPPEAPVVGVSATPSTEPEGDETDLDEGAEPTPGTKPSRAERRITGLLKENTRLKVEWEKSQQERDAALRLLDQRQRQEGAQPQAQPQQPATPQPGQRPQPNDYPTHEEWIEAISEWKADQRIEAALAAREAATRQAQQQQVAQTQQQKFDAHVAKGREAFDDFDMALSNPAATVAPHIGPVLFETVAESEQGHALLYYLGQHPDEVQRLNTMTQTAAARQLGAIEARLQTPAPPPPATTEPDAPAAPGQPPAAPRRTPPPPIPPVNPGASATTGTDLDSVDFQTFMRIRNQQQYGR